MPLPIPSTAKRHCPRLSHATHAVGLPTLLVLLASNCAGLRAPAASTDRTPIALVGVPTNTLIRWPSLAVRSDTVFIAANVFPSETLTARPAYLGRLRQAPTGDLVALPPLELPPGDFQFAYPRIISVDGTLHLVWAEFAQGPPPKTAPEWQLATYLGKSLWHSALHNGVWTTPEKIATGDAGLGWSDEAGSVAADASGTLHVALWQGNAGSAAHVRDFRLTPAGWKTSTLPYTGLNTASAIATLGDTAVLALVAEDGDTARVVVIRSSDHSARWTNAAVVSSRPRSQGMVTRLTFVRTADALVLAIGEKANDSPYLDTIRVLKLNGSSELSTTQFGSPSPLLPPMADQFVIAGTSCGSVAMLTRELSASPRIFEITIPSDLTPGARRRLLGSTGFSLAPGIIGTPRSAVAVFVYNATASEQLQSAAMTLPVC